MLIDDSLGYVAQFDVAVLGEISEPLKGFVWNGDRRIDTFQAMEIEEPAVEVGDFAQERFKPS